MKFCGCCFAVFSRKAHMSINKFVIKRCQVDLYAKFRYKLRWLTNTGTDISIEYPNVNPNLVSLLDKYIIC